LNLTFDYTQPCQLEIDGCLATRYSLTQVIEQESDTMKKYIIELGAAERHELECLLRGGKTVTRKGHRSNQ